MSSENSEDGRQPLAPIPSTTVPQQPIFFHPSALFQPPATLNNVWPTSAVLPPMFALPPPEGSEAGTPMQYVMLAPGPGMMYAFPPAGVPAYPFGPEGAARPKRKQVKRACQNCANACKRCDEARPCERCEKYGIADTCEDQQRKERQKGIKRGPYKRKNKNSTPEASTSGTMPEGAMWPQPLMVPFPIDAEGMQPFILPPGPYPMPGVDLSVPPPMDANGVPHPAFFPFPFAGLPQFVPGPAVTEGTKAPATQSEENSSEGRVLGLGSAANPLEIGQDSGIAPSQLERPGRESVES